MFELCKNPKLHDVGKLPFWRGIYILFILLFAGILFGEIVGHTLLKKLLPQPSVGADSFEFDNKIGYLEEQIKVRGQLDCLIVGDSMANNGLDPTHIEDVYRKETGTKLTCFNIGMPALTLDASGPVAKALVHRFQPRLLVFILSPRDFVPKYGEVYRHIASSAWVKQNLGETSLKGWAVNSSFSYRYLLAFQYWLNPANREKMITSSNAISPMGFSPVHGFRTPGRVYGTQPDYDFYEAESQKGLAQLLQIHNDDVSLLIIDAPIQPDYHPLYLESPDNYHNTYITLVSAKSYLTK